MQYTATAPGKIVICGEYAVLWGAPALVMALNRRATATIRPAEGPASTVVGNDRPQCEFHFENGNPVFGRHGEHYALFAECLRHVTSETRAPMAITLETGEFNDPATGEKLGIGSSAALAVAIIAALVCCSDRAAEAAHAAHRAFQGGRGSGIDVAAALHGGLLRFVAGQVSPMSWPQEVDYAIYWSGRPADTAARLRPLPQSAERDALLEHSLAVADLWFAAASADRLVSALHEYTLALRRFDERHALAIFANGHERMAALGERCGVMYKPCGAGGGDVGIAVSTATQDLTAFSDQAQSMGFVQLTLSADPLGCEVVSSP